MEKVEYIEENENGAAVIDVMKTSERSCPYRYTKEELLEIKESPWSNQRHECLSEKYDSDGIWDPEKWHASLYPASERSSPVDGFKNYTDDRAPLKRRIADPRERVKEDDLDVVLSPQRRSFGGGCQVNVVPSTTVRREVSPLENKENENLRLGGGRRIGSGRIIASRVFERDPRGEKELREREPHPREREPHPRERERERDYKDKRFRRDFGDKRVFGERRRNDSYTEEEPEWFSGGPTSQSETIELTGFDDKVLEEDKRRYKRSRKRSESVREAVECNGGLAEEPEVEVSPDTAADQEVPQGVVLPEPSAPGEFDFNEFFNLDKTVPGLASMIEDVLGEGTASASRFSQWFSSNVSPSASRSSSLRSTPHEELERLAGLEHKFLSPAHGLANYFAPIQSLEDKKDKVDILEMLQKAKVDLKPLLSSLTVNKEKLKESSHSGVVLSLEEVETGLKGLKVEAERKRGTPFMAEQLEEALTVKRDGDMSAFNKLVSSMKAGGTLPAVPKGNRNLDSQLMHPSEVPVQSAPQKNILQEILGPQAPHRSASPNILSSLLGSTDPLAVLQGRRGPSPPLFPQRAPSPDYFPGRLQQTAGFVPDSHQQILGEHFPGLHRSVSPGPHQMNPMALGLDQATLEALAFQQDLALHARQLYQPGFGSMQMEKGRDTYRNRQPWVTRSPGPGGHRAHAGSPANAVTSMLSPSFTPTSVIRKMYETKEKSKDELGTVKPGDGKEEGTTRSQEDNGVSPTSSLDHAEQNASPPTGAKPSGFQRSACSTPLSNQSRFTEDQDYRPRSAGRKTPTMVSPVPSAPFPRPVCQLPLVSHVPLVRPAPPQLHPGVVQRLLAQGFSPQQLPPALLQAGMFPQGVDLSQLQGLPPPLLGQPFYPLAAGGHPLLGSRPGAPLHLAVMQQQPLQQRPVVVQSGPVSPVTSLAQSLQHSAAARHAPLQHVQYQGHAPQHVQYQGQRNGSPVGLAKWFGTDVLQQPLPSMPAKVISVDELEYRQ
ncbi:eukaryotic translation initiation factor 4E transporter-like [Huso huso]|uniref:Eukaryotic translation initiation factor 4E transporter-like n=1 Tax=Huso huso TaxID=61971 RepID=A0ABR0ZFS7_HUSHU